jgi:hypothetical protein
MFRFDPRSLDPEELEDYPTFYQGMQAAFFRESVPGSTYLAWKYNDAIYNTWDEPNFHPLKAIEGTQYEPYQDFFADVRNNNALVQRQHYVNALLENERIIHRLSGLGFGLVLAAAIFDPINLIPVGGTIGKAAHLRTFGRLFTHSAKIGFKANTLQEVALKGFQPTRSYAEVAANITGGTFITGILGGGAGKLAQWARGKQLYDPDIVSQTQAELRNLESDIDDLIELGADEDSIIEFLAPLLDRISDESPETGAEITRILQQAAPDIAAGRVDIRQVTELLDQVVPLVMSGVETKLTVAGEQVEHALRNSAVETKTPYHPAHEVTEPGTATTISFRPQQRSGVIVGFYTDPGYTGYRTDYGPPFDYSKGVNKSTGLYVALDEPFGVYVQGAELREVLTNFSGERVFDPHGVLPTGRDGHWRDDDHALQIMMSLNRDMSLEVVSKNAEIFRHRLRNFEAQWRLLFPDSDLNFEEMALDYIGQQRILRDLEAAQRQATQGIGFRDLYKAIREAKKKGLSPAQLIEQRAGDARRETLMAHGYVGEVSRIPVFRGPYRMGDLPSRELVVFNPDIDAVRASIPLRKTPVDPQLKPLIAILDKHRFKEFRETLHTIGNIASKTTWKIDKNSTDFDEVMFAAKRMHGRRARNLLEEVVDKINDMPEKLRKELIEHLHRGGFMQYKESPPTATVMHLDAPINHKGGTGNVYGMEVEIPRQQLFDPDGILEGTLRLPAGERSRILARIEREGLLALKEEGYDGVVRMVEAGNVRTREVVLLKNEGFDIKSPEMRYDEIGSLTMKRLNEIEKKLGIHRVPVAGGSGRSVVATLDGRLLLSEDELFEEMNNPWSEFLRLRNPERTDRKVNVNDATLQDLAIVPGLGPKRSQRLIDFIQERGPIENIEELSAIDGFGPKLMEGLRKFGDTADQRVEHVIETRLKSAFGFEHVASVLLPNIRILTRSRSEVARRLTARLFEIGGVSLQSDKVARQPMPVETMIKRHSVRFADATRSTWDVYMRYLARVGARAEEANPPPIGHAPPVKRAGQMLGREFKDLRRNWRQLYNPEAVPLDNKYLGYTEFRRRVGLALYFGDTDAIERFIGREGMDYLRVSNDETVVPEVSQAASIWRDKLINPLFAEARTFGLITDADVRAIEAISESYFHRVYNVPKVRAEQVQIEEAIAKYLMEEENMKPEFARAQARRKVMAMMETPSGRIPYDIHRLGKTGALRSRIIDVPDEVIMPWLETDIDAVGRLYLRTMAPDIEIAKLLRSVRHERMRIKARRKIVADTNVTDRKASDRVLELERKVDDIEREIAYLEADVRNAIKRKQLKMPLDVGQEMMLERWSVLNDQYARAMDELGWPKEPTDTMANRVNNGNARWAQDEGKVLEDLDELKSWIDEDYDAQIDLAVGQAQARKATQEQIRKMQSKLNLRRQKDKDEIVAMIQLMRNTYAHPWDASMPANRFMRAMRRWNVLTMGGGFMVSSIPDVGRLVMANTMGSLFGDVVRPILRDRDVFRELPELDVTVADFADAGVKDAQGFFDLANSVFLKSKLSEDLTVDPVTGKKFTAQQLIAQMQEEGSFTWSEFARRRGYTDAESAEYASLGMKTDEEVAGGASDVDIQYLIGKLSNYHEGVKRARTTERAAILAQMAELRDLGAAFEIIMNNRASLMTEVQARIQASGIESVLERGADLMFLINGMSIWNDALKETAALLTHFKIARAAEAISQGRRVDSATMDSLRQLGLDERLLRRIHKQLVNNTTDTVNGVRLTRFSDWTDELALEAYRTVVKKQTDNLIITPGVGDRPLLMSTEVVKTLLQFKSFAFAATSRLTLSSLQRRDKLVMQQLAMMWAMGVLTYGLKQLQYGSKISTDPRDLLVEGVDRSGMTAALAEVDGLIAGFSGGEWSAAGLIGAKTPSRFMARRGLPHKIFGPSYSRIPQMAGLIEAMATGDVKPSDIRHIRNMIFYQNVVYLDWLGDAIEQPLKRAVRNKPGPRREEPQ